MDRLPSNMPLRTDLVQSAAYSCLVGRLEELAMLSPTTDVIDGMASRGVSSSRVDVEAGRLLW